MTLKDYLKEKGISIKHLSTSSNVPYSTVNDIVNRKTDIDKVMTGITLRLADACKLSFTDFYSLAKQNDSLADIQGGKIIIKNKCYYLSYGEKKDKKEVYLFKVNKDNERFVKTAAEWEMESIKRENDQRQQLMEMNEWARRITS